MRRENRASGVHTRRRVCLCAHLGKLMQPDCWWALSGVPCRGRPSPGSCLESSLRGSCAPSLEPAAPTDQQGTGRWSADGPAQRKLQPDRPAGGLCRALGSRASARLCGQSQTGRGAWRRSPWVPCQLSASAFCHFFQTMKTQRYVENVEPGDQGCTQVACSSTFGRRGCHLGRTQGRKQERIRLGEPRVLLDSFQGAPRRLQGNAAPLAQQEPGCSNPDP